MTDQWLSPVAALDAQASARSIFTAEQDEQQFAFQGHGFELGNLGILIPPSLRCEVVENLQLCSLPGTAKWLVGMAQLRGRIIPVFDLQTLLFDNPKRPTQQNRVLVVEPQNKGLAIVLPKTPKRLEFTEQQILENHSGVPDVVEPFCRNVFYDDGLWLELDIEAYFTQMSTKLVVTH